MNPEALQDLLDSATQDATYTSIYGCVVENDVIVWSGASAGEGEPPSEGSRFDLASLTKPVVATLAMRLHSRGELSLDARVPDLRPNVDAAWADVSLGDLLRHCSGLQAWYPTYHDGLRGPKLADALLEGRFLGALKPTYSDLGYMLWAFLATEALSTPLARLIRDDALLGLLELAPDDGSFETVPCVCGNETEVALARELGIAIETNPETSGRPQDGNARYLGGVPGHAGLFGTAGALLVLAAEWLAVARGRESKLDADLAGRTLETSGPFACGWAKPAAYSWAAPFLPPSAFGHLGFTGASLWLVPETGSTYLLLGSRRAALRSIDVTRARFLELATGRTEQHR